MKFAVLISGSGSNLQAFIDAGAKSAPGGEIAVVLSNRADAFGLQRALEAGIATHIVEHRAYAERESFDQALVDALAPYQVDLVILAGFMRILTPVFIHAYSGRLLNIHPSLLPKYPGLHTHQRALDAGDREAGATVHFVTEELDGGPPVIQARVPVLSDDNAEKLAARVLQQEHRIYPMAVRWFAGGRLRLTDAGAELDGAILGPCGFPFAEE